MRRNRFTSLIVICASVIVLSAVTAQAQSGAGLLVKPWAEDQFVEAQADGYFLASAHSDSGHNVQFSDYSSSGRFRLVPGNIISPRIGYDLEFFNTDTKSKLIPKNLSDQSIAIGTAIGKYEDWVAGLTLGAGYAGDTAFARGSGWYGKATLAAGRKLNGEDALAVVVDYNGNRPYFPDFPLPGFVYSHRLDPTILLALGVPFSSIEWTPIDHLKVEGTYELLSTLKARVSYEIVKHVTVYTSFDQLQDAFHVNGFPRNRRLLFSQHRLEGGVQFVPNDHLTLSLAGGYAFGNRFQRGFDYEDNVHPVLRFSDTPYVHAGLELRF